MRGFVCLWVSEYVHGIFLCACQQFWWRHSKHFPWNVSENKIRVKKKTIIKQPFFLSLLNSSLKGNISMDSREIWKFILNLFSSNFFSFFCICSVFYHSTIISYQITVDTCVCTSQHASRINCKPELFNIATHPNVKTRITY